MRLGHGLRGAKTDVDDLSRHMSVYVARPVPHARAGAACRAGAGGRTCCTGAKWSVLGRAGMSEMRTIRARCVDVAVQCRYVSGCVCSVVLCLGATLWAEVWGLKFGSVGERAHRAGGS